LFDMNSRRNDQSSTLLDSTPMVQGHLAQAIPSTVWRVVTHPLLIPSKGRLPLGPELIQRQRSHHSHILSDDGQAAMVN